MRSGGFLNMYLANMKVGKSIEINVTREEESFRLVSKIEEVFKDKIYITLIRGNKKPFQFLPDDKIEFIYRDQTRIYLFREVKGTFAKLDDMYVHCLFCDQKGEAYNRRNAFRVYMGEAVKADIAKRGHEEFLHDKEIDEEKKKFLLYNQSVLIKDLSETGTAIYCNENLQDGDYIEFQLKTELGSIHVRGEIVRKQDESQGIYRQLYGINFVQKTNNLTKFIFARQRKLLQYSRDKRG